MLPTNNTSVSNKDSIIRRGSIRNSKTLQQLIDLKPNESMKNVIDSVVNYPIITLDELEEGKINNNNDEHKL